MEINRIWQMPNSNTFDIKPINQLINKYRIISELCIDPFANTNKIADITNDINPEYNTTYNLDATEFLQGIKDNSVDLTLYDPPYSPRQVSECYKSMGLTVNMQTTQASYWSNQKKEISRITKPGGYAITCSWNSGGIGKKYEFEPTQKEIKENVIAELQLLNYNQIKERALVADFQSLHDIAEAKGFKKGWIYHQLSDEDQIRKYAAWKGYKEGWITHQLNQRENAE